MAVHSRLRGFATYAGIALAVFLASTAGLPTAPALAHGPQQYFDDAKLTGTFVLYDVKSASFTYVNQERAEKRAVPASTFKIANSLIALETGAVSSVDQVFPTGSYPKSPQQCSNRAWCQDMGMREAIRISNVPLYQEVARRIGPEQMGAWVAKLNYGNANIGDVIDRFWLDGPLEISPVEQTQFLASLSQQQLPASTANQNAVRDILRLEQTDTFQLYGKSGWDGAQGWWVGWVEREGNIFTFALNVDMTEVAVGPQRIELGKALLRHFAVLP